MTILQAVQEVLEEYATPDSPEGLACAMYQLKRIYNETIEKARWREKRRRAKAGANRDKLQHHNGSRTVGEAGCNQGGENKVGLDSRSSEEGAMISLANVAITDGGSRAPKGH
jgi:hypothetical protein